MRDIIVGIDPDAYKSGICVLDTKTRSVLLKTLKFSQLVALLDSLKSYCTKKGLSLEVVVEAGWLNAGIWHLSPRTVR